jgi:photosystem II stability/assembly factor-like uncharacterized protein
MIQYLTVWGSNSNQELNIPERLGAPIGLNSNLVSGYRDISKFYLGNRHGVASKPSSQNYFKPLYSGIYITGYEKIIIPINTSWGDNTFFQREINRTIGNLNFYYDKFDLGIDTTYAIDVQLGLIHGFGADLILSDISRLTGQIVNWTFADLNSSGIPAGNLALYPRGFLDVKAGDRYVLALNSGKKITGWGNSGHPVISGQRYTGINAYGNIREISAGESHALVLFENGFISGWGDNSFSQLGIPENILSSGVKISTKLNYNLAMGLKAPSFTNITGNNLNRTAFNITGIGWSDFDKTVTGLEFQFSSDRSNWNSFVFPTGLNARNFLSFTGNNFPTGNINYYVRLTEYYNSLDEQLGWRNINFSGPINVRFRSVNMSYDGRNQTILMVSGNNRTYPYRSTDFGLVWQPITGISQIPFLNDHIKTTVKLSRFGNLQLIAGPRTAAGSGPYQVLLSRNSGINWTGLSGNGGFGNFSVNAINHINASEDFRVIAVARQDSFLIISHNTGTGWFQASGTTGAGSRNWEQIAMSENGGYMLASQVNNFQNNQVLFRSDNSGLSWTSTSGILSGGFAPVEMSKNGQIQIVGSANDGPLFISYDAGLTWRGTTVFQNRVPNASWRNIAMSRNGNYIIATNSNDKIFYSDNSGVYWSEIILTGRSVGPVAISSGGRYITAINAPSTSFINTVAVNGNFGLSGFGNSFFIKNTGSSSIFNPSGNTFNVWTDYRVIGWGGGDSLVATIPDKLKNERIIDIAAGYNNNLILTEKPIAENELKANIDLSRFLDSNVLVTGAGLTGFNRTYLLDGEANGRPLYRYYDEIFSFSRPTDILIFWNNVSWGLYSGLNNLIYFSENDVDYPWLGTWATNNIDYIPVPNILEVPLYVKPVPAPCVGFYFDTN